ncbi:hypothetical protein K443DRAFT_106277, partial [Laccaria amethystina LaAM-08-1]
KVIRSSSRSTNTVAITNHPCLILFREDPKTEIFCGLSNFLFELARFSPRDIDTILHVVRHAKADESLPTAYWTSDRPAATFAELFNADFRGRMRANIEEGPSNRPEFLAASLLSSRCMALDVLSCSSSVAAISDGLKLSDYPGWNNEMASTSVAGACLQLLGGDSDLGTSYVCDPPEQVLEALKRLSVSGEDEPLLKFTIATLENPQRRDLSGEEILAETSLAGWKFWNGEASGGEESQ